MTEEQLRILVADDEESVRNLLRRTLESAGYNVVSAANGQEALDKVSQVKIDAALLDIKMPGMSGIEVLQNITANWPNLCVNMVTAVVDTQIAVEAMKMGAYDYIAKPFNQNDVVLKVQRAIKKRNLLLENESYRLDLERRVDEQTKRLQAQFVELVETLGREYVLLCRLAERERGGAKSLFARLPQELRQPVSSVEEFSEALLGILRRGARTPAYKASTDSTKDSKQ